MANRHRRGCAATAALLLLVLVEPAAASPESLARRLAGETQPEGVVLGLCFAPVSGEGAEVRMGAARSLPPASVQKIVTAAAALDILGPDHQFETRLLSTQPVLSGRISGDLYLQGGGDPFLVSERLWLLAREMAVVGVERVEGDLVVDAPVVADLDSIRRAEKSFSPYAAPISPLSVNFNSISFIVRPGVEVGDTARIEIEPCPLGGISVASGTITAKRGAASKIEAERVAGGPAGEAWLLRGSIAIDEGPLRVYASTSAPALAGGGVLRCLLEREGIRIGRVRAGVPPESARVIASLSSLPLGVLLHSMNAHSNNVMADMILTGLGDGSSGRSGADRVRIWLRERIGLDPAPTVIDGSGLSGGNRISPEQVVRILVWSWTQEAVYADLAASFARPGGVGTMRKRFGDGVHPPVRAKTGTLGDLGVSGIAGYIDHPQAGRYAFCILQQASSESGVKLAALREREEVWLLEFAAP